MVAAWKLWSNHVTSLAKGRPYGLHVCTVIPFALAITTSML